MAYTTQMLPGRTLRAGIPRELAAIHVRASSAPTAVGADGLIVAAEEIADAVDLTGVEAAGNTGVIITTADTHRSDARS